MPAGLIALALGGLGLGLTEFVIMGLLPEVAADFAVTEATAGWLISGYALSVAVGALVVTAAVTGLPRKPVLMGLLVLFIAGNFLSAVADGYRPPSGRGRSLPWLRLRSWPWLPRASAGQPAGKVPLPLRCLATSTFQCPTTAAVRWVRREPDRVPAHSQDWPAVPKAWLLKELGCAPIGQGLASGLAGGAVLQRTVGE